MPPVMQHAVRLHNVYHQKTAKYPPVGTRPVVRPSHEEFVQTLLIFIGSCRLKSCQSRLSTLRLFLRKMLFSLLVQVMHPGS